jgi:SAM-dependent methyltransferase
MPVSNITDEIASSVDFYREPATTTGIRMSNQQLNHEFDRHAAAYTDILDASLALSGYDSRYFDEYKVRELYTFLEKAGTAKAALKILNFGCGVGKSEKYLSGYFPTSSIFSTDVSPESIRIARECNKDVKKATFDVYDGDTIPFDESFDIIFCAGVFHHILQEQRIPILASLKKKLSPDGRLFIFEHNPWNPLTRRVVASCPLDENASLISSSDMAHMVRQAGFNRIIRRFIVFFPRRLKLLARLERLLCQCPLGAQYYITASR